MRVTDKGAVLRSFRRALVQGPQMRPCDSGQTDAGLSNMVDPTPSAINIGTQSEPKKPAPMAIGLSVAMANYALTDTLPKTVTTTATEVKPVKAVKADELTCEEFLSCDEVTRPQIVYSSEGLNGMGKPEDL